MYPNIFTSYNIPESFTILVNEPFIEMALFSKLDFLDCFCDLTQSKRFRQHSNVAIFRCISTCSICSTFPGYCPLLTSRWLFWKTSTAILVDKPLRPASSSLVDYPRWLPSRLSSVTTLGDHPLWLFTTTVLCNHSLWPFPITIRYLIRSPTVRSSTVTLLDCHWTPQHRMPLDAQPSNCSHPRWEPFGVSHQSCFYLF